MKTTTQQVNLLTGGLQNWGAQDCLKEVKAMMMESKFFFLKDLHFLSSCKTILLLFVVLYDSCYIVFEDWTGHQYYTVTLI